MTMMMMGVGEADDDEDDDDDGVCCAAGGPAGSLTSCVSPRSSRKQRARRGRAEGGGWQRLDHTMRCWSSVSKMSNVSQVTKVSWVNNVS